MIYRLLSTGCFFSVYNVSDRTDYYGNATLVNPEVALRGLRNRYHLLFPRLSSNNNSSMTGQRIREMMFCSPQLYCVVS